MHFAKAHFHVSFYFLDAQVTVKLCIVKMLVYVETVKITLFALFLLSVCALGMHARSNTHIQAPPGDGEVWQ